eukprot:CAMPEP_0173063920 /NCGR_PEP_ID=MMETSP1102-20130122/4692_1 /TAXON_ID=49646 /ORGANISM="Geminigera sp., Strain Caron Lab Isolate" /LENGTH=93 /DNA_ID=CAMNT_0013930857 /DNA_START=280 /DNA_END=561 /DNA_ORIENTATION=-
MRGQQTGLVLRWLRMPGEENDTALLKQVNPLFAGLQYNRLQHHALLRSDPSSSRTRHHSGWWYQDALGRHWYAPLNGTWFCAGIPNIVSTWAV